MEKFRNGFRQHKTLMMKHLFRILVYYLFSHLELGVYSLLWSFAEGDKLFGPMNRGSTLCGVAMMMIMMSSIIKHYSNQFKSWHKLKCWNKLSINVRKYSNSFTFVAPRISFAKYKSTINRILQAQPQGIKNLFSPHVEQKRTLGQMKSYKHSSPKVSFWCLALIANKLYLPIIFFVGRSHFNKI